MVLKYALVAAASAALFVGAAPVCAAAANDTAALVTRTGPPIAPSGDDFANARDEALAYAAGLQGYIYGYPALDYMRIMREQTTPGLDPKGVYAPVNAVFFQNALVVPGSLYAGRGPNTDTIYFTGWLDLSHGPVTVDAPDTHDRYYALTFADFYSEVQHTGRRTTGTKAQKLYVVGPDWKGEAPAGVQVIRMRTQWAYILGRVLVDGPKDFPAASKLMRQFKVAGPAAAASATRSYPVKEDMTALAAFRFINTFLRTNPRLPGEQALMDQFDKAGFGPNVVFDEARLSDGTRQGLARAIRDGNFILQSAPRARPQFKGWSPMGSGQGPYGSDYLSRAITEAHGILANVAAESVYPSALTDANGQQLMGTKRYRIVFPADKMPPHNGFWALNAYDLRTVDLIPNAIKRYGISDRMPGLKHRADGALELRIQQTAPAEKDVNWLPVNDGPFFLTFRIYQPGEAVLKGQYTLPAIEPLP